MTKFYYSYNSENKAFVGKYPAIKNPRRQSEYLLPAMATFKAPPETKKNEVAIWSNTDWIVEADFRGELQVNIETKEISTIDYVGFIKAGFQKVTEVVANEIQLHPEKFKKIETSLVDISDTEEYKNFLKEQEAAIRKSKIEEQLLELDSKRIRAICEPSIKDEITGETWLDYYNNQVTKLRKELSNLYYE